jgi:diguanylate cyclase (GGDEF)-like protein
MTFAHQSFARDVSFLKAKATRQSLLGVVIALGAVIVATTLVAYVQDGRLTMQGLLRAQQTNFVLWFLDLLPICFPLWGQYVGAVMAREAGAMVVDQTQELRGQTAALEFKAHHEMTHDTLTGLPNRILLHDRVAQAIHRAKRDGGRLALLVLDVDRFKEINESLGHFNGDRLLKQLAVRLTGVIRASDTLARLGGDEFAFLVPNVVSDADVQKVVRTIQKAMDAPFSLEKLTLDVRASIGAAIFPEHGQDVDTLMQLADVAMYAAKQDNQGFVIFNSKLSMASPQRLTLMGELRQAIESDELMMYYQPKFDNGCNRVTEVEALVRWQHPQHGLMQPAAFIPLAERTGLIKQLSIWVLKTVLQQSSRWRASGLEIAVSVNLSAQDLLDPELPDIIAGLLAQHDVPAKQLVLEITETSVMADPDRSLEILNRIAGLGVRISIDDFGTGYSSLAYLRKLPVTEIKIDRSFVMEMLDNPGDEAIVQATIGLAQSLGLDVVAEGVENDATMVRLKSMGCNLLQGYHISRPMAAMDFPQWQSDREKK